MYMIRFWNIQERVTYNEQETGEKDANGKAVVKRSPTPYYDWVSEENRSIFEIVMAANTTTDPKTGTGNPTDLAITRYMYLDGAGKDAAVMRTKYPKIQEEPFNSTRKRMSAQVQDDEKNLLIIMKGASELMVDCCKDMINLQTGEKIVIDEAVKEDIVNSINGFARQALRTIVLCYKYTDSYNKDAKDDKDVLEDEKSGFTMVGIAGIRDVIRTEVPNAVKQCNRAGIQVKMVTGDNAVTAEAIAKECNIIDSSTEGSDKRVMLGSDFYDYVGGVEQVKDSKTGKNRYTVAKKDKFKEIYHDLQVLVRSRPLDKLCMVVGLRENGYVVAVTGDGTNDAPALTKANVGFAMGLTGTDIAKQAADILLTKDNFVSIVSAVKWGRNIFDSVRKFLQFQLTVNVVAVLITFTSAAIAQ